MEDGQLNCQTRTVYSEDGEEQATNLMLHVLAPGDSFVGQHPLVIEIASAIHTPARIAAYAAQKAAQG